MFVVHTGFHLSEFTDYNVVTKNCE